MSEAIELDRVLSALAGPRRRQVVELLRERPSRAGEIGEAVGLSPAALMRHLRALKQGGLKLWLGEVTPKPRLAAAFLSGCANQTASS